MKLNEIKKDEKIYTNGKSYWLERNGEKIELDYNLFSILKTAKIGMKDFNQVEDSEKSIVSYIFSGIPDNFKETLREVVKKIDTREAKFKGISHFREFCIENDIPILTEIPVKYYSHVNSEFFKRKVVIVAGICFPYYSKKDVIWNFVLPEFLDLLEYRLYPYL